MWTLFLGGTPGTLVTFPPGSAAENVWEIAGDTGQQLALFRCKKGDVLPCFLLSTKLLFSWHFGDSMVNSTIIPWHSNVFKMFFYYECSGILIPGENWVYGDIADYKNHLVGNLDVYWQSPDHSGDLLSGSCQQEERDSHMTYMTYERHVLGQWFFNPWDIRDIFRARDTMG